MTTTLIAPVVVIYLAIITQIAAIDQGGGAGSMFHFVGDSNSFQGNIKTRIFPPNTFETGFTISLWFRPGYPSTQYGPFSIYDIGSPGAYFTLYPFLEDTASPIDPWFHAADYGTGAIAFMGNYMNAENYTLTFQEVYGEANDIWVHHVFSFNSETKSFFIVTNAGMATERFFNVSASDFVDQEALNRAFESPREFPSSLYLGTGYPDDFDLIGDMDEVCVFSTGITVEQAISIRELGCREGTILTGNMSDLVLHYDFDFVGNEEYPLFDSVAGRQSGIVGSSVTDTNGDSYDFLLLSGKANRPYALPSDAPVNAGKPSFRRLPQTGSNVPMPITCTECTQMELINQLPQDGIMCFESQTLGNFDSNCPSNMRSIPLNEPIPVDENATVLFVYVPTASTLPGDQDTYTIVTDLGTTIFGKVLTNVPPILANASVVLNPGDSKLQYIPEVDTDVKMFTSPSFAVDVQIVEIEGADNVIEVYNCDFSCGLTLSKNYYDYYYEYEYENATNATEYEGIFSDEDIITNNSLPLVLAGPNRRILVRHADITVTGVDLRIKYRVFDGLEYSNDAFLIVSVPNKQAPPFAKSGTLNISEDSEPILIDLSALITDKEGDSYTVEIEKLPQNGKLYQYEGTNFSGTEQEIEITPEAFVVNQFVTESELNIASQCYNSLYCAGAVVGEPDIYPGAGDSEPTWQPLDQANEMWVQLVFEEAVYATSLTTFEVWSPGGVYKIEGENHADIGYWETLYEGETNFRQFCPDQPEGSFCAGKSTYNLCPKPFRINKVKLYFAVEESFQFPALDAVLLNGFKQTLGNFVANNESRVWYKPNSNFHGIDKFTYAASDCPYFQESIRLRGPDSRRAEVQISVRSAVDLPVLENWNINNVVPSVLPQEKRELTLNLGDPDGLTLDHRLTISAIGPDNVGIIEVGGNEIHYAPYLVPQEFWLVNSTGNVSTSLAVNFAAQKCLGPEDLTFNFRLSLTDDISQTSERVFAILVACSKVESVLRGNYVSANVATTGNVLGLIGVLYSTFLSFWIVVKRNTQAVTLSQGLANLPIIFGALLVYCSLFPKGKRILDFENCEDTASILNRTGARIAGEIIDFDCFRADFACQAQVWAFTVGTTSMLSTLLVKMERVNAIFNNPKLKKVKITECMLVRKVFLYVFVWVGFLSGFETIAPHHYIAEMEPTMFSPDEQKKVTLATEQCRSDSNIIFNIVVALWFAALIIRGSFLAFVTRKVVIRSLNDSQEIGLSFYNILILGAGSYAVSFIINDPTHLYYTTVIPIFIITTFVLSIIYVPKILGFHSHNPFSQDLNTQMGKGVARNTQGKPTVDSASSQSGSNNFAQETSSATKRAVVSAFDTATYSLFKSSAYSGSHEVKEESSKSTHQDGEPRI